MPDAATEYAYFDEMMRSILMPRHAMMAVLNDANWCSLAVVMPHAAAPPLGPIEHYITLKIISSTFKFEYLY